MKLTEPQTVLLISGLCAAIIFLVRKFTLTDDREQEITDPPVAQNGENI